ncbi:hypothetical protein ACFCX0_08615 [Streptomyces sp. NPDC056352]|uniref:hypothetical protein n=1 Tax=Streptomyces sp. NPDC056352 TaxID=3345791 RepID=UPI0035E2524C
MARGGAYLIPEELADDGWTVLRVPFAEPGIICGEDVDDRGDGALLFLGHVRTVVHTEEDRSTRRELALKLVDRGDLPGQFGITDRPRTGSSGSAGVEGGSGDLQQFTRA